MKQLTISEIKTLDHKMPVPSFVGTIDEVYEQKTGVGEYGPWFLQNLMVSDGTGSVTVTWGGEDPFDQGCKGKTYSFECSETKHGLKGVSWERRKKDGKTYENVKVTQSAKIKILSGAEGASHSERPSSVDSDKSAPTQTDPDWPEAPVNAPQSPVARPNGDPGVKEAREHLCQAANLYNLCVKCVDTMVAPNVPQIAQTSEMFQAAVGTLFIEASRAGYVSKMPQKPIS